MSTIPTLEGITSHIVQTDRLKVHVLTAGPAGGAPVLFIHGNGASATFWEETMLALPPGFRGIAPTCAAMATPSAAGGCHPRPERHGRGYRSLVRAMGWASIRSSATAWAAALS